MKLEHFDKFVESLKEKVSEENRLFRSWVGDYSSDILNFINQHEEVEKAFQLKDAPGQYRQFNIFDHPSFIGVSSQDPTKISYLTWNAIVKHNLLRIKFRSKESEDVTIWKHIEDFKNEIHAPLTYTEATEDGSRVLNYTDFGQRLYDVIYNNVKKELENGGK